MLLDRDHLSLRTFPSHNFCTRSNSSETARFIWVCGTFLWSNLKRNRLWRIQFPDLWFCKEREIHKRIYHPGDNDRADKTFGWRLCIPKHFPMERLDYFLKGAKVGQRKTQSTYLYLAFCSFGPCSVCNIQSLGLASAHFHWNSDTFLPLTYEAKAMWEEPNKQERKQRRLPFLATWRLKRRFKISALK